MSYTSTHGIRRSIRLSLSTKSDTNSIVSNDTNEKLFKNNVSMNWDDFQDTFYKSSNWMSRYNLRDTLMFRTKDYYDMCVVDNDDEEMYTPEMNEEYDSEDIDDCLSVYTADTVLCDTVDVHETTYNFRIIDPVDYTQYFSDEQTEDEIHEQEDIDTVDNTHGYGLRDIQTIDYSKFYKMYPKE